jgi:hypothetical protein
MYEPAPLHRHSPLVSGSGSGVAEGPRATSNTVAVRICGAEAGQVPLNKSGEWSGRHRNWLVQSHTGRYGRLTSLGLYVVYVLLRALVTTP